MPSETYPYSQCASPDYSILPRMKAPHRYHWLPALALVYCLPGLAATVYKSVDQDGVVTFSDTAPRENILLEEVEINFSSAPPSGEVQQRLEDMRETTDRMATDRMAREKHRAEMRELQAKTDAMQAPQYPESYSGQDDPLIYTSGYYGYDYPYRYRRPGHGRPIPPIYRPPLRPPGAAPDTENFPAPHIRPLFTPRTRGAPRQ